MPKLMALVAEDEAVIRRLCGRILEGLGYQAIMASHGLEALKAAEEKSFDLVIVDLRLPDLNGIQLLKSVRKIHPVTDVIVITGYATLDNALESWKEGAADYLRKPFTADELQTAIQKCQIRRRLAEERSSLPELAGIHELCVALSSTLPLGEALNFFVGLTARILRTPRVLLFLLEGSSGLAYLAAGQGFPQQPGTGLSMDLRQSALAQALSREEPSLIEGRADDPFLSKLFQGDNVPRQLLCSPLIAKGKIVGGLLIGPRESGEGFDADDEKALSIMSYQAALAVENARLIESNERRIAELSKLEEITEILRSPPPEPTLFSSLARSLPGLVEHDICALLLTSPEGGRLSISASLPLADGIKQELAQRMTQELDRSSQGRVHLRELEVAFFPEVPSASAPPLTTLGSVIMLPLTLRGERNGVLALARAKEEAYDLMSRKVIQIVAHLISSALDHRELGPDRREDYLSVVRALSATLEAKDSSTRDHSFYAARYAKGLALQLDLPPEEVDRIVAAALLHDIGKVGIPESIIGKPGKLTPEEYQKVQQHAVMGAKILESVDFPWDLKSLILYHHERFDGKGYPSGLRGEEIPLGARILSIAEAYEMMITGRYHPRALTPSEAAQELTRNAGTHFDPQLVSRFLDSLSEKEGN